MNRIPLWIDLRHDATAPLRQAAKDVQAERILDADAEDVTWISMDDAAAQERAASAPGTVIVEGGDWTIIPLENLIAARRDRPGTLFALARGPDEAVLFRDTLEVGVHGIVLRPEAVEDVVETDRRLRERGLPSRESVGEAGPFLQSARVLEVRDAGPGERICVDCTSTFQDGEGLLVGSSAKAFALIHAETLASEFVNPRPFRVNAGAVHSYLLGPDGRTQYLSEVEGGHQVLAVHRDGTTRTLTVGRAKLEERPHTLVRWETTTGDAHVIVQTAETIRFVRPDGRAVAVTDLEAGHEILVHTEQAARHFGMPVDERLEER